MAVVSAMFLLWKCKWKWMEVGGEANVMLGYGGGFCDVFFQWECKWKWMEGCWLSKFHAGSWRWVCNLFVCVDVLLRCVIESKHC